MQVSPRVTPLPTKKGFFMPPNFEKVGSILVSARLCVHPSVRPSVRSTVKATADLDYFGNMQK